MSRRVLVGFLILNVIVSLAVAMIIVSYDRARRPDPEPLVGPTEVVYITTTPIPNSDSLRAEDYQATIDVLRTAQGQGVTVVAVVTATPEGFTLPEGTNNPTIPPELLPPVPSDIAGDLPAVSQPDADTGDTPAPDDGCVRHVVQAGESPSSIALSYGLGDQVGIIMRLNGIDDPTSLQVDQVLIIPVPGCALLNTPTPEPSPSATPFNIGGIAPTVTAQPLAVDADIAIEDVLNWGDVNNEVVELRNEGDPVNLQGWTLTDEAGNSFLFPEAILRPGIRLLVYTRTGTNSPAALYWGRDEPMYGDGEILTLADSTGEIKAAFIVGQGPASAVPAESAPPPLEAGDEIP